MNALIQSPRGLLLNESVVWYPRVVYSITGNTPDDVCNNEMNNKPTVLVANSMRNPNAGTVYVKLYDTLAPTGPVVASDAPVTIIPIAAGASVNIDDWLPDPGYVFQHCWCCVMNEFVKGTGTSPASAVTWYLNGANVT